jgi:hypothetical protein
MVVTSIHILMLMRSQSHRGAFGITMMTRKLLVAGCKKKVASKRLLLILLEQEHNGLRT